MRKVLNSISMDGVVVIGEGEKDEVRPVGCCIAAAYAMVHLSFCIANDGCNVRWMLIHARLLCCVQAPMLYCGEKLGDGR